MRRALVIGAGPAGLMAASELARAGLAVTLAEAKPSVGRKFLMAGKSGLNLTKDEPLPAFTSAYAEAAGWLAPMLAAFGPSAAMHWARSLGQEVFTGSSGRVFPLAMKASPLLRAWLADLARLGVVLRPRWRWQGIAAEGALRFETPEGPQMLRPDVTVLALGGASWARLGSDAAWVPMLAGAGVQIAPFRPANMGFLRHWSDAMRPQFGAPVKGVALRAGDQTSRGEFVITARGVEGGGIYALSRVLREGAPLLLDLAPDLDAASLARRLGPSGGQSIGNRLRRALGPDAAKRALAQECGRPLPADPMALAALLKALPLPFDGPQPLDEAISVAGGIARAALDDGLRLRALPGIHAAGEMLDWEAPTGGYLLTACLATGRWAGRAAAGRDPSDPFSPAS